MTTRLVDSPATAAAADARCNGEPPVVAHSSARTRIGDFFTSAVAIYREQHIPNQRMYTHTHTHINSERERYAPRKKFGWWVDHR